MTSSAISRQLTDFLNHGHLPFVGRVHELDLLSAFWHCGREAERLRVALLVGEAGVGKSRLVSALAARIRHEGGVELRVSLHPEAANAIAPSLTHALWYSDFGRMLLREQPEETLPAAIAALRRLARLRPALVVIEDLHLLGADAVPEVARLLDALADEPLSILCTARPAALTCRGALQPFLIEEIALAGLGDNEIRELWLSLFSTPPAASVAERIATVTAGNALAVRSALRCAAREIRERPAVPLGELVEHLARDANLMQEGLIAPLSPELRSAAGRMAQLGEIFSRRAAAMLVDDAAHTIERLLFLGVIAPVSGAMPTRISGVAEADAPLAFTHSLVHRHLAESASPDVPTLARLLCDDVAVFTLLPYELAADAGNELVASFELLAGLYSSIHDSARLLDNRGQWVTARRLLALADRLIETATLLSESQRQAIDEAVVRRRLNLLRRDVGTDAYRCLLGKALAQSANPASDDEAKARIYTLHFALLAALRENDDTSAMEAGAEIDAIVERFPGIVGSSEHVMCLGGGAQLAIAVSDDRLFEAVEREFRRLLDCADIAPALRSQLLTRVAPPLLLRFETPEELEGRRELLGRIREVAGSRTPFIETIATEFLALSGDFRAALAGSRRALRLCTDAGLRMNVVNVRLSLMLAELATSELRAAEHGACIDAAVELLDLVPPGLRATYASVICSRLGLIGWLRMEDRWMRTLGTRLLESAGTARLEPAECILLGADVAEEPEAADSMLSRLRRALSGGAISGELLDEVEQRLLARPACAAHLVRTRAIVELLGRGFDRLEPDDASRLRMAISEGVERSMDWLIAHELCSAVPAWTTQYRSWLQPERHEEWRRLAEARTDDSTPSAPVLTDEGLRITMIGEIRYGRGADACAGQRVRGVRNRTLLGLMVAKDATGGRLSHAEFCRLATGIDDDPERARKMTNVAVHRLRELLGRDAIDTGGESPRLARGAVAVDLLDAITQLEDCEQALRDGILARAVFAARRALATLDGEVAWPSLYGPFFEAAREELECRLRRSLVRIGESLLMEGDVAGAEEILRTAVDALPGDDELRELLEESLEERGKLVETELLRTSAAQP